MTGTSRPRWSVVIPVHDCADYLAQTLPEVMAQLGQRDDAEIIVVDDASQDDPAAIVGRIGGGRIQYRPNPGHLGAVGTFNRCLDLARGDLVHLLHGDDMVRPGFYSAMEQALGDPTTVAAVCRVLDVDADNVPLYVTRSYRERTGLWRDALDAFAVSNRVRAPGIVVRRSAYERVGGFRIDLPHAADWEMWTRLAADGPIVFVDRVLACYRRHAASDTSARSRTGATIRERVTAIGMILDHVAPERRGHTMRRALAYSVVFATRTALASARKRDWSAAIRQGLEALRCAWLMVHANPFPRKPDGPAVQADGGPELGLSVASPPAVGPAVRSLQGAHRSDDSVTRRRPDLRLPDTEGGDSSDGGSLRDDRSSRRSPLHGRDPGVQRQGPVAEVSPVGGRLEPAAAPVRDPRSRRRQL